MIALASALGAVMDGDTNVPDRTGNRHPALAIAPYNTYPCTRRLCGDLHRRRAALAVDVPDAGPNGSRRASGLFDHARPRQAHAEIDDIVGAWTLGRTKDEVLTLLNEAHVPCAPVKTAREVANDPHLEARGFWVDTDHPRRGKTRVPISPIRLHTGGKSEIRSPAPTLGQHTEAVLGGAAGIEGRRARPAARRRMSPSP